MAEKENINKEEELVAEESAGDTVQDGGPGQDDPAESEKKNKKAEKAHHNKEKEEEELRAKVEQVNDKYLRLAAEFDNYRRRTAKERLELISTAGEDIIKGLLPVLDDCERALQVLKESGSDKAAIEGTELIYSKLMSYLKGRGLSVIDAIGQDLDTDFHEAVAQMPVQESDKKNKIIDVIQQGYKLNDKVIRFAKVVVGV